MKSLRILVIIILAFTAFAGHMESHAATPRAEVPEFKVFCRMELSANEIYDGESVMARLVLYTPFDIQSINATDEPQFKGFASRPTSVETSPSYTIVDGRQYFAGVIKQWILTPEKTGKRTVKGGTYKAVVLVPYLVERGFHSYYQNEAIEVTVTAEPVEVKVLKLPKGKPSGYKGAVGIFENDVQLSSKVLTVGDEATLSYMINGLGNPGNLSTTDLVFPDGLTAEIIPEQSIDQVRLSGKSIVGTKCTVYKIKAKKAGRHKVTIPAIVYFDPDSHEYQTIPERTIEIQAAYGEVYEM